MTLVRERMSGVDPIEVDATLVEAGALPGFAARAIRHARGRWQRAAR